MSPAPTLVEKLREQHQRFAENAAKGRVVSGISQVRTDRLRKNPAFVELIAAKRAEARGQS